MSARGAPPRKAPTEGLLGPLETERLTPDRMERRLREKIGPAAELLETIRGVGYRFKAQD